VRSSILTIRDWERSRKNIRKPEVRDQVMGSIEKFGKEVIPAVKAATAKAGAAD
jgi:hypothetical protein